VPTRIWIPAFATKTERRRQGGKHLRTTTSDYATNIRDLRFRAAPLRGDLVPPQAVYADLRDALRASTVSDKPWPLAEPLDAAVLLTAAAGISVWQPSPKA
jgi:hypothetical protein